MTGAMQAIVGASILAAGAGGAVNYAACGVRSQWFGRTVWRGRTDTASVALTFDDGPGPDTEAVLDALGAENVKGAFFLVGRQVERHPDIARRIISEGHEIGNHSYSHPLYLSRTPRQTRDELTRAQQAIADVTGVRPVWSRPPYGVRTPAYFSAARSLGLRTIQWTVAGFDWKRRSAERITDAVLRGAAPGAIVLLHDADSEGRRDRRATAASIPAIVDGVRRRGLQIAPLHALLADRASDHPERVHA
jgi:peptidoglycan/xylan/chitin deacetylase (PgdA/CDA1 family)